MNIILLRHGTRNFTLGDVPLNDTGWQEALSLAQDTLLLKSTHILSSPKERAQKTVTPLSEKITIPIIIDDKLDQMMRGESEAEFTSRVQLFLSKLVPQYSENDVVTICSHSDWLSTAVNIIPSDALSIKHTMFACAEYLHFVINDGIWIIQD